MPRSAKDEHATIGRELRAFREPQLWIVMGLGAIGFGGFFAVYSYISPIVQNVTGLSESAVPLVLVVVGLGMVVGGVVGGHLADHSVKRTIYVGLLALVGALLVTVLTAQWTVGMFVGAFLIGATSSAIPPAVQSRLMDVAGDARTIAAALNHSAFNIGNSLGAALGGAVIAAGFGFLAPGWLGIVLALLGVGVTAVSYGSSGGRRHVRRCARRTRPPARSRHPSRPSDRRRAALTGAARGARRRARGDRVRTTGDTPNHASARFGVTPVVRCVAGRRTGRPAVGATGRPGCRPAR